MRKYFFSPKELAAIIEMSEYTIREWCRQGKYHAQKCGSAWKIPTEEIRKEHRDLPVEFWEEIVEDLYRGWNGEKSARIRLNRRKAGMDPSTNQPMQKERP